MTTHGPLTGIRVLDLGQYIAGPSAGQTLSDLGADVIKIESVAGDQVRGIGDFGESMLRAFNRDKRSVSLDLTTEAGKQILHRLLAHTDVLVQNFRVGSAERLGLGATELMELYRGLIYASVSGYGTRGPSKSRPGLDIAAQAEFGMMHTTGEADGEPQRMGFHAVDTAAANALVTGILAALFTRTSTGRGTHVETSLLEAALSVQAASWGQYTVTGEAPERCGNGQALAAPAADAVSTADGTIVLSAYTASKFVALCNVIGRPEMAQDPRFADNPARVANRPELMAALAEALSTKTREEAVELLMSVGIVAGAVRSYDEIAEDKDVIESEVLVHVSARDGASYTSPGLPFTLDGKRRTASEAAPELGQHTAEVLAGLGYSDHEIDVFTASRVVTTH
ncbi:CaiB/BaiF CoA transferase family protein [Nocardioides sp. Root151]|uniref:CaiB/BaiF CoA transferase family protein n=1 Tax=Nocardioides sp. Root151 TaxID=1736475 RepID=UPI000702CE41|nr:CoA transferase [Nocardioides sp. Root151]KQZ74875.1 carnitine dehydratase [Nocardioides sp. Root151]